MISWWGSGWFAMPASLVLSAQPGDAYSYMGENTGGASKARQYRRSGKEIGKVSYVQATLKPSQSWCGGIKALASRLFANVKPKI